MKKFFNLFLIALVGSFLAGCGDSKSSGQATKADGNSVSNSGQTPAPSPAPDPKGLNVFFAKLLTDKKVLTVGFRDPAPTAVYSGTPASDTSNFPAGFYTLKFDSATALESFTIPGRVLAYGDDYAHRTAPVGDGASLTKAQLALIASVSVDQAAGTFSINLEKKLAGGPPNNSDVVLEVLATIGNDNTMSAASGSRKLKFIVDQYTPSTFGGTGKVLVYNTSGNVAAPGNRGTTTPFAPPVQIDVTFQFPAA